jgi:hypothetical protein
MVDRMSVDTGRAATLGFVAKSCVKSVRKSHCDAPHDALKRDRIAARADPRAS